MIGFVKKLLSGLLGIFGLFGKLLPFGKKEKKAAAPKQPKPKAVFLDAEEAKGYTEPTPKAQPKAPATPAPAASTASSLNLPQPTVTTASNNNAAPEFVQFGPRRRPGANMKAYLDMARTMKA